MYGKCGDLTCHDDLNNGDPENLCYGLLESSYKFYLAFENSLCQDYLSEKFYNALVHRAVPVVLSGADMSLRAPPHSFINVEDFNSTSELAAFLTRLAADEERLASYFWWRDYYEVVVRTTLTLKLLKCLLKKSLLFFRSVVRLKINIGVTCVLFSIKRNHLYRKLLISGKSMMRMTTAGHLTHLSISPSTLTARS